MGNQSTAENKLAELLIDALNLEELSAEEIDPETPLFGDELGLDSIDALEIALAISQTYGVQMKAEEESTRQAFTNLRTLSAFIEENSSQDA